MSSRLALTCRALPGATETSTTNSHHARWRERAADGKCDDANQRIHVHGAGATIAVIANATDPGGAVATGRVLRRRHVSRRLDGTAWYSVTWQNVRQASRSLTAVATDSKVRVQGRSEDHHRKPGATLPAPWLTQDVGAVGLRAAPRWIRPAPLTPWPVQGLTSGVRPTRSGTCIRHSLAMDRSWRGSPRCRTRVSGSRRAS